MRKSIHTSDYKDLAKWLRAGREARGLSQRELANLVQVHHSVIWKIEASERRLDVLEYIDYCLILGVNPLDGIKLVLKKRK